MIMAHGSGNMRVWDCGEVAPTVYMHSVAGDGSKVMEACRKLGCPPFNMVSLYGFDFDGDMTPWPAPGVRKGQEPFRGNAQAHLEELISSVMEKAESSLSHPSTYNAIAGYSLAGLFALWSAWNTDRFARIACGSASLWYPGFVGYAESRAVVRKPDFIYLSLGDNESNTRNQMMNKVGECTEKILELLERREIPHVYETTVGNHFSDPDGRMARAIKSMLTYGGASPDAGNLHV